MKAKPRLLLLDAGAVIIAWQCGGWAALRANYQLIVPSIVVAEAHFYPDRNGKKIPIDLAAMVQTGEIQEYEATPDEFAATSSLLHASLRDRVHEGEQEALTYLRTQPTTGVAFVSADGGAIEAAVAFGFGDAVLSLETVLQMCGHSKRLPDRHSAAFVRRKIEEGSTRLIQGRALA
jgi:hypothetical protein